MRRRAEKREQQLQEARKGRFKESLSLFERKRAADRERVKGNESFKVCELHYFSETGSCCAARLLDTADGQNIAISAW